MKKIASTLSYITAFSLIVSTVIKFHHWPGAMIALAITGILISFYFGVFILDVMSEKTGGSILPLHIAAALSAWIIVLGFTFKIWVWPGGGIILTLGIACFCFAFIPMLFMQKSKEAGTDNKANVAGALGVMTFALGTLFKLQHWPAASILLILAPVFLFLLYFPMYMLNPNIDKAIKHRYLRNCFFAIVAGTLIIQFFFRSTELHEAMNIAKTEVDSNVPAQIVPW